MPIDKSKKDDWLAVRSYLRNRLVEVSANRVLWRKAATWVRSLGTTARGRLLASCLAIDLASEAVSPETLLEIVEALDSSGADACLQFAKVLRTHPMHSSWICASRLPCGDPESDDHCYVRVLELSRFIRYYLKPSTGRSSRPDQAEEVLRQYISDADGQDLSDITAPWAGPSKRVWVLPKEDYVDLVSLADPQHPGTVFQEALGLSYADGIGMNHWPHLISVTYPRQRHGGWNARQPTALDADWTNQPALYVSYPREDGWGRTQNCYQKLYTRHTTGYARERVHPSFDGLTAEFRAADIGLAQPYSSVCQEEVVRAAVARFVSTGVHIKP